MQEGQDKTTQTREHWPKTSVSQALLCKSGMGSFLQKILFWLQHLCSLGTCFLASKSRVANAAKSRDVSCNHCSKFLLVLPNICRPVLSLAACITDVDEFACWARGKKAVASGPFPSEPPQLHRQLLPNILHNMFVQFGGLQARLGMQPCESPCSAVSGDASAFQVLVISQAPGACCAVAWNIPGFC